MSAIIITDDILSDIIPFNMRPKRLDSATSLLFSVKNNNIEGLFVYNPSPDIWKTWFPFYDTENKYAIDYDFKSETYGDLIKEYDSLYDSNAKKKEERIAFVKDQFKKLYNINNVNIIEDNNIKPLYQLRYSKTANTWSLYKLEFFIVKDINNKSNVLSQKNLQQAIFPYKKDVNELFEGMPITDSLIFILNDKRIVDLLKEYIIKL